MPGETPPPHRGAILLSLMLSLGLAALDANVVATAIPSIVRDLGGFSLFPWVFSIYLLTQAITIPIYGRLADQFGRKPVLLFGIGVFLLGSALSGASWNMTTLIVFRGLQGIGAGAVQPMAMTVAGDIYTVEERAKVQGYLSGVWGIASVVGPALGGFFSEFATWRWIFYINLPVGAFAVYMLVAHLHESVERRHHRVDYAGTVSLTAGLTLIIFALLQGGVTWAWTSPVEVGLLVGGAASLGVFAAVECATDEPVLPPWLVSRRPLLAGNLAAISLGALIIGLSSYLPTYAQGVLEASPVIAGLTLASVSVGWVAASRVAGRLYLRIDFRDTGLIGAVVAAVGAGGFVLLKANSNLGWVALAGAVHGVGLGFAATAVVVCVQSIVPWQRRGVVTGANMFNRSIGSAIGVAVFGSIANSTLSPLFRHPPAAIARLIPHTVNSAALVLGGSSAIKNPTAVAYVRAGLFSASHRIFIAFFAVALLGIAAIAMMPRKVAPLTFPDDDAGGEGLAAVAAEGVAANPPP